MFYDVCTCDVNHRNLVPNYEDLPTFLLMRVEH